MLDIESEGADEEEEGCKEWFVGIIVNEGGASLLDRPMWFTNIRKRSNDGKESEDKDFSSP